MLASGITCTDASCTHDTVEFRFWNRLFYQPDMKVNTDAFGSGPCRPIWHASKRQWIFSAKLNECDLDISSEEYTDDDGAKIS